MSPVYESYHEIAQEQGSHGIPNGMPPLHDWYQTIATHKRLLSNPYNIRHTVEQHYYAIADQHSKNHYGKELGGFDDEIGI